jgi:hypothetical protein
MPRAAQAGGDNVPEYTSIGTVTDLPADLQWIDEFSAGSDLVAQSEQFTITGSMVVQASAQQAGRFVTLQGRAEGENAFAVLTRAQVLALRALAATPGAIYTLTLCDGREMDVMFRRENPAIEAEAWPFKAPQESSDFYLCTINLIQV